MMSVAIFLEEKPFDFRRLREARRQGTFASVREERVAQLRESQSDVRGLIQGLGGRVLGSRGLVNIVDAEVPAAAIPVVAGTARVLGLRQHGGKRVPHADGLERRLAMGLTADARRSQGFTGEQGSTNSSGRVVVGVIEMDGLNGGHRSFRDGSGTATRIVSCEICGVAVLPQCFDYPGVCPTNVTVSSHATNVAATILSDLEQSQDSTVTGTTNQQKRGGIAPEASLRYYHLSSGTELEEIYAIDRAVEQGVDIINLSIGPEDEYCNSTPTDIGLMIASASWAGVLTIMSAGNDFDDVGGCTVNGNASTPHVFVVGAHNNATSLAALSTVASTIYSGRGSELVNGANGAGLQTRWVDLATNGTVDLVAGANASGYVTTQGTSFSAPQVSGLAALLKDWINDRGGIDGLEADANALRVLLYLFGDGGGSTSGSQHSITLDEATGFGHPRFVNLDSEIGAFFGAWGIHRTQLSQGQVVEYTLGAGFQQSTLVNGWKFAAFADEEIYQEAPEIKYELIDKCPSGGGVQVVSTAIGYAGKARMRLRPVDVDNFRGRCLSIRMTGLQVSSPVWVYTADYYYTTARSAHDM